MKHSVRTAAITISNPVGSVEPARAYQVDCAILFCLAGGWPASAPCADARAVFIRRITPWPFEPPLQIWRSPLGASFGTPAAVSPMERFYDIAFRDVPQVSEPPDPVPLVRIQSDEPADIDISGDAFDFVRSIRVFHIQFSQRQNRDDDCIRSDGTRLGSYGNQGDFHCVGSSGAAVPAASDLPRPSGCGQVSYRSVLVDWRDHEGNYGFEEVRYLTCAGQHQAGPPPTQLAPETVH